MSVKDKIAIVTGGSRGIGRAIVLKLASEGCNVAFNYSSSDEAANELKSECEALGVKVLAKQVDIKDFELVKQWIDEVKESLGGIDILINNAGITRDKIMMMMSKDDWDQVIQTNLNGTFHATKSCIVTFMKQKSGQVVNISSVSGVNGLPGQTNYSATKGAINAFTKALAKEVAGLGIRVNAVAPGFIDTEMLSSMDDEKKKAVVKEIPAGKMGSVDDVANAVTFLLSQEAQYITGQIIHVDGGLVMR